jgi:ring-1,2-phenylacetyl-CoA epoxidase subunit PaaD
MVKRLDHAVDDAALEARVRLALARVHDPEIPPLSITDLGIVRRVQVTSELVEIDLLPTFSGCPALDAIREDAQTAVEATAGDREVRVRFVFTPAWTSDLITPAGREALRTHGLTPPDAGAAGSAGAHSSAAFIPVAAMARAAGTAECPFCGSRDTVLESAFGPTLCRATHFCRACRNPFESFKPKRG